MSAADPWDPAWLRRLSIHLHEQSRRDHLEVVRLEYEEGLAAMYSGLLSKDGISAIQSRLETLGKKRRKLLQPWVKIDVSETARASGIDALRNSWTEHYGDPNDPAVQAKIAKTVEWLTKNSR